jgi:hypothetical protein
MPWAVSIIHGEIYSGDLGLCGERMGSRQVQERGWGGGLVPLGRNN